MAEESGVKISVVVPVYNVENYLARCLHSLAVQTHRNLEIILVDDGSTDASGRMCDEFAAGEPRAAVLHKPNGGLSSARNAGMDAATGDYLMFLDSDDWIAPGMASVLLAACEKQDADIAECGYQHIFADAVLYEAPCSGAVECTDGVGAVADMLGPRQYRSVVCNKLYRRGVTQGVRFPVGKLHEDEFTVHHFYFAAQRVAFVDVAMHYYDRTREGTIMTAAFSTKRLDGCEALHQRMHLIWDKRLDSLEKSMNDRYCYVLFYRLSECVDNNADDERVAQTVATALENWQDMRQNGRPINPCYPPLYAALGQGLPAMRRAWAAHQANEEGTL